MRLSHSNPLLALAAMALAGCASVSSTKAPSHADGLVYYLPNRDIVIAVTVTEGKITSLTATPSEPYADRSRAYVLRYHRSLLAKNRLEVDVGASGLLTTANANQTGDAVQALAGLGQLAGYSRALGGLQSERATPEAPQPLGGECQVDGTHTYLFEARPLDSPAAICGGSLQVSIRPHGWRVDAPPLGSDRAEGVGHTGIFYRTSRPFKISVTGLVHTESLVFSPSGADEQFLPIAGTAFANNDAQITLRHGEGVPSKVVQDTDGELAALLKIPATILQAYFAAVGSVFSSFGSNRNAEIAAREAEVRLELAKQKQAKCLDAIREQDAASIAALGCGGS